MKIYKSNYHWYASFKSGDCNWDARWERSGHKDDEERPEYKSHRIIEEDEFKRLNKLLNSNKEAKISQTDREHKEKSPLNYDLTSLQRSANNMWSWSARRTLRTAQDLYDKFKLTSAGKDVLMLVYTILSHPFIVIKVSI